MCIFHSFFIWTARNCHNGLLQSSVYWIVEFPSIINRQWFWSLLNGLSNGVYPAINMSTNRIWRWIKQGYVNPAPGLFQKWLNSHILFWESIQWFGFIFGEDMIFRGLFDEHLLPPDESEHIALVLSLSIAFHSQVLHMFEFSITNLGLRLCGSFTFHGGCRLSRHPVARIGTLKQIDERWCRLNRKLRYLPIIWYVQAGNLDLN